MIHAELLPTTGNIIYTTLLRHSGSKNQNNTTKPKINEKKKNKTKSELNQ
jgi:hypothetical protein